MRRREPPVVVFHTVPDPVGTSRAGEIDQIYARSIRRRLDESGMTSNQKAAAIDALISRLRARSEDASGEGAGPGTTG